MAWISRGRFSRVPLTTSTIFQTHADIHDRATKKWKSEDGRIVEHVCRHEKKNVRSRVLEEQRRKLDEAPLISLVTRCRA